MGVEPEGQQVDLASYWQQPTEFGTYRLGAILSLEPGHRSGADAEVVLLSGWQASF